MLGDEPLEDRHRTEMEAVARALDEVFNGEVRGSERKVGFVLLVFPFGDNEGRANFISNGAGRADISRMFKELSARFDEELSNG